MARLEPGFAEGEERASFWEPLATQGGAAHREEDAVTVLACAGGPSQLVDAASTPQELIQRLGGLLAVAYAPQIPLVNQALVIISPEHYDNLLKGGFDSKWKLAHALWRETAAHMAPYVGSMLAGFLQQKRPGFPSWIYRAIGRMVGLYARARALLGRPLMWLPKFSSPESLKIVVAGGPAGKFSAFCPGFGVGSEGMPTANMSRPVTELVEPRPATLDLTPAAVAQGEQLLDPAAAATAASLTLAPRAGGLKGPVALLDISKARGSELMDVFEAKLRSRGVVARRYRKPTFSRPCPDGLAKQIASECRAAILGLAD